MVPIKIAVLGAPDSGTTQLASELVQHFRATSSADGLTNLVVADAPPLMAALYADLLHNDQTRYAFALTQHQIYDLTLVCGLDTPGNRNRPHDTNSLSRETVDARLRAVLAGGKIAYAVIYGQGLARLDAALKAISRLRGDRAKSNTNSLKNWQWTCEKCSDPECEHRMFTGQLNIGQR